MRCLNCPHWFTGSRSLPLFHRMRIEMKPMRDISQRRQRPREVVMRNPILSSPAVMILV